MSKKAAASDLAKVEELIAWNPPVVVRVDSIHLDPDNANGHDRVSIDFLKASLSKFGQTESILVRRANRVVIGGNGRLAAMREMGWVNCEVRFLDVDAVTATALALALNRTQQLSQFDFERVAGQLKALNADGFDIKLLGWQDHELEPLLAAEWSPPAVEPLPTTSTPNDEPHPHAVVFPAEIWAAVYPAILKLREMEGDQEMKECRALELIVADWMSGK